MEHNDLDRQAMRPPVALFSEDADLTAQVRRISAAASVRIKVARGVDAHRAWAQAPAVIVDVDYAEKLTNELGPVNRRSHVLLIHHSTESAPAGSTAPAQDSSTTAPQRVARAAVDLGADGLFALPIDEARLLRHLARSAETTATAGTSGVAIGIMPGHGGAGATVLATAIAHHNAANGHRTTLIDLDPYSGGIDLTAGCERTEGLRWPDLAIETGSISAGALRQVLPSPREHLAVLSTRGLSHSDPIDPSAAVSVLTAARAKGETCIVDLGHPSAAAAAVTQLLSAVIIVSRAHINRCASSHAVGQWCRNHNRNTRLVLRGPSPSGARMDDLARAIALPLLGTYRTDRALTTHLEARPLGTRRSLSPIVHSILRSARDERTYSGSHHDRHVTRSVA